VGVRLDAGEHHPGFNGCAMWCYGSNPNAFANVYIRGHNTPDALAAATFNDAQVLSFGSVSGSSESPTLMGGDFSGGPYRYVTIIFWTVGGPGTTGSDHILKIQRLLAWSNTAYESAGESTLMADDVIADLLTSGSLPLLETSTDEVESTSFAIPDYWPAAFSTPRQIAEAVNAYHDYDLGVDVDRRVFFRAPDEVPVLEAGDWSGSEWSDATASSGEDTYNKVVVEASGADGQTFQTIRYSADAVPESAFLVEVGTPSNGGFESSTTGWTGVTGSVTRVSGGYEGSWAGSALTASAGVVNELSTTLSGLTVGRIYTVKVPHRKNNSGAIAPEPSFLWWAGVYNGSQRLVYVEDDTQSDDWSVHYLTFVAPATSVTLKMGGTIAEAAPGTSHVYYVDGVRTYQVEVNVVDRHGFVRAARLPVDAALTPAAAEQIGVTWLRNHVYTPLKGSLSVTTHGGVRSAAGGAPLHPGHLLLYYGRAIRLSNLENPDTGGWGRTGRIASVSYDHDRGAAVVEVDNERGRLEAFLARLSALTGQVA
jgi:hypothetical protein